MNFIYIFEDGQIGRSSCPPTDEDKRSIRAGILRVLRVPDGRCIRSIGGFGEEVEVEDANLDFDVYCHYL